MNRIALMVFRNIFKVPGLYSKLCKYASEREIVAAEAERSSIKYKLVEFMQDKVGYTFGGHVSGLTEWGMYV